MYLYKILLRCVVVYIIIGYFLFLYYSYFNGPSSFLRTHFIIIYYIGVINKQNTPNNCFRNFCLIKLHISEVCMGFSNIMKKFKMYFKIHLLD